MQSTLKGRGGIDIAEFYDPEPIVYLAIATPGFPNYFIMNGVRGDSLCKTHSNNGIC
jgi:hypothetical protein